MPKNNNIEHEPMYVIPKWNEPGNLEFIDHLNAINVKIVHAPSVKEVENMIGVFMTNTWNDRLNYGPFGRIDKVIKELFAGNILPTGMEIINLTFTIEGMDMIDTTHLIRHRMFSFSAQTQADRDMRNDRILVSPQIAESIFLDEYLDVCHRAHDLYMRMVDCKQIDMLEARTIMPAAYEKFYICRGTIKDIIAYCNLRCDEQIQPWSDVIIAMKLWFEVIKIYPFLKDLIDFTAPDWFYVKQCSNGKTNIFPPLPKNDTFEWNESQFLYDKPRSEFLGYERYEALRQSIITDIRNV